MSRVISIELSMRALLHEAVARVRASVAAGDGAIVASTQLSNKALSFQIEVRVRDVPKLLSALGEIGVVVQEHARAISRPATEAEAEADAVVMLHVGLVHGEPDMRVALPKVPG